MLFGTLFYQLLLLYFDVKREHTTTNSPFSVSTWIQSSKNSTSKNSPKFEKLNDAKET